MSSRINQNWVFGQRARLDFSAPAPSASASTAIDTLEGCASLSDVNGGLLMYTDGRTVWDAANTVRATGLLGNTSSTQSAIIVPDPGNAARYYVFTADGASGTHNHVDGVRIDTGTPAWTVTPLSSLTTMPPTAGFSATEKVTAIQHRNCRDFWVLTVITTGAHQAGVGPGTLRVFLVSGTGVQYVADTPLNLNVTDVGYLKASGTGEHIAIANWSQNNVLVYPFDNATGSVDVAGLVNIPVPAFPEAPEHARMPYGVEFSPGGNVLYYSVLGSGASNTPENQGLLFQHDLLGSSASVLVGRHPNAAMRYALGALQLGMDNRIYIAQDGENALGVIANPDVLGPGCGVAFSAVALPPGAVCYMGLPNLIAGPCGCPCEEGNCDEAVNAANHALNERAGRKHFTVHAQGQRPRRGCVLAFEQRDFAPQFSLHWGDGPSDQMESHDTEIIFIRARNPYRNLLFRGVKIFSIRVTPNQPLPGGGDALQLVPAEIVCFDEVGPCGHVSRDFAFLIENAVVQDYQITFEYCIEETVVVGRGGGRAAFDIKVVAS
ncbi:MAG TPA: hypothetical protein VHG08_10995 [Longimicrobium sp.]|nr:hypothetical protein [Longimicrobium sp.]